MLSSLILLAFIVAATNQELRISFTTVKDLALDLWEHDSKINLLEIRIEDHMKEIKEANNLNFTSLNAIINEMQIDQCPRIIESFAEYYAIAIICEANVNMADTSFTPWKSTFKSLSEKCSSYQLNTLSQMKEILNIERLRPSDLKEKINKMKENLNSSLQKITRIDSASPKVIYDIFMESVPNDVLGTMKGLLAKITPNKELRKALLKTERKNLTSLLVKLYESAAETIVVPGCKVSEIQDLTDLFKTAEEALPGQTEEDKLKVSSAYWRFSSKRQVLEKIQGIYIKAMKMFDRISLTGMEK